MSNDLAQQAERFGAEIIQTAKGVYHAQASVIASGVDYKRLGIPGEEELIGRGIQYCATGDGPFYRGKKIARLDNSISDRHNNKHNKEL